jgi:hypothetical protein
VKCAPFRSDVPPPTARVRDPNLPSPEYDATMSPSGRRAVSHVAPSCRRRRSPSRKSYAAGSTSDMHNVHGPLLRCMSRSLFLGGFHPVLLCFLSCVSVCSVRTPIWCRMTARRSSLASCDAAINLPLEPNRIPHGAEPPVVRWPTFVRGVQFLNAGRVTSTATATLRYPGLVGWLSCWFGRLTCAVFLNLPLRCAFDLGNRSGWVANEL